MEKEGNSAPATVSDEGELGRARTEDVSQDAHRPAQSSDQGNINNPQLADIIQQNGETISDKLDDRISDMFAKLDEMGPTVSRYQYDEASSEVQRLTSEMKERALSTMIHHLRMEDAKTCPKSQTDHAAVKKQSPTFVEIEIKLKELEKQSNKIARRINEHKREQAHTLEKIQILEARSLLDETNDFIKDILMRVPTEADMQNLETLRLMTIERRRAENRIQMLNRRASALDKAMGSVAKSKWFRGNQVGPGRISYPTPSDILRDAALSSRELNSVPSDSREVNSSGSGRDFHKKNKLPDFTQMSSSKRDAFLAQNFPQGTKKVGQDRDVPEGGESGTEDREGIGKSAESSGVTIVTLSSNDAGTDDIGRQQASAPVTPDDGENRDEGVGRTLTGTDGPEDPSREGSERNTDQTVNKK